MDKIIRMQQVHGNNVVCVSHKDLGKVIENCDGLITNDKNITLEVKTADCMPISIIDNRTHAVGLVHVGWRGIKNEIIKNAINLMIGEFNSNPKDLLIKIGPHICNIHHDTDLESGAREQLSHIGVVDKNIEVDERCTYEDVNLPSYRRDKTNQRTLTHISPRG